MVDYEKLGAFYLGRRFDPVAAAPTDDLLLYDSKDLTTHAVCVGMTGSGKTGLCITLLEEAAIDGIPVIAIDPKGDLSNLLLTFPELKPEDFAPWIDPEAALRAGLTVDEQAKKTAEVWRRGLVESHQDGQRIARLKAAADFTVYTPGSNAGQRLALLRSFAAPPPEIVDDAEAMRDRVESAVSGLLALVGIDADPIRSREHILLSNILDRSWRCGRNLDLESLIAEIQTPPFQKVGVLDLASFFPPQDRFDLAMTINNLLASPGFAAWMEGEALDIGRLLHTADGRPRVSILSISHLSDAARMFFVTLLLNEVVAWMRTQSGTTSLRAILYMDEVFGYFPPTATPPSKKPMLTLLKQARAFGFGVVLATQNPVDLDYKGLANAGTWFIGRLQTERDKMKVLEGLEGAAGARGAAFDRAATEQLLAGLAQRVFLMNSVHEDQPVLFQTRWALSYLRGPLTRAELQKLATGRQGALPISTPGVVVEKNAASGIDSAGDGKKPVLAPDVPQTYLALDGILPTGSSLVYRPALLAKARVHFVSTKHRLDTWRDLHLLLALTEGQGEVDWSQSSALNGDPRRSGGADSAGRHAALPAATATAASYGRWEKSLSAHLFRTAVVSVFCAPTVGEVSGPGELEGDFRVRLRERAREKRDLQVERLRVQYAPRLATLRERLRTAEERKRREESQASGQKMQTAISIGASVLGAFFGRRGSGISQAATALRGASRIAAESGDVQRVEQQIEQLQQQFADLEQELRDKTAELEVAFTASEVALEKEEIKARKTDIAVDELTLAWTPWVVDANGIATARFIV